VLPSSFTFAPGFQLAKTLDLASIETMFNRDYASRPGMAMQSEMQAVKGRITSTATSMGIAKVGFTSMERIATRKEVAKRSKGMRSAISLLWEIPPEAAYDRSPIDRYYAKMLEGRALMDHAAREVADLLRSLGFDALPVTSEFLSDPQAVVGQVSHRDVAYRAGMGWIGRSTLLVTPEFGPRVRLITVLTEADLHADSMPMASQCGDCRRCVDQCPMKALNVSSSARYPGNRSDSIDHRVCDRHERSTLAMDPPFFCAQCVSVCPVGREAPERIRIS
jgi:epoxyqueuosine reductase QueG